MALPCLLRLYKILITVWSIHSVIQLCACDTYHKIYNNRLLPYFYSTQASSTMACCSICDQATRCRSISYNKSTKECQISYIGLAHVDVMSETTVDWVTCSKHDSNWVTLFQGVAGIGTDVYDAWLTGKNTTQDVVECMRTSVTRCTTHFRSRLADDWYTLGIKKIRFSLYNSGIEYRYITFNGIGANLENWFSQGKVLDSNMKDVGNVTGTHFSMAGYKPYVMLTQTYFHAIKHAPSRRFYICNFYNICETDRLLVLVLTSDNIGCDYDKQGPYPHILFAYPDTWANPNNWEGMKSADAIRISVRLQ